MARVCYAMLIFQSTHSRGVRHAEDVTRSSTQAISIHALTRSATRSKTQKKRVIALFQSTHSRGVRRVRKIVLGSFDSISIHALTRSATCQPFAGINLRLHFNPRTHEECDFATAIQGDNDPISIHALTRSATLPPIVGPAHDLFQSTHSRGVRL